MADTRDMYMVHTAFRREFGLMPALVRGVAAGDVERVGIVADHITLVADVLHHHHHTEDTHLWPRLLDRAAAELAPVVHTMESQHEGIEKAGAEVSAGVDVWCTNADPRDGAALADALDRFLPMLTEHLELEEQRVLAIIEQHITAAEWAAMVQDGASGISPELMPVIFGMMMYEGDPEVVQDTIEHMPAEIQPVIGQMATTAFAEHSQRVHGTSTPPRVTRA
jgi:hemerythrin-like domain-containing protein